jgi:hypothetical protein
MFMLDQSLQRKPDRPGRRLWRESNVQALLDELDRELIGLTPVKTRIREIASLLLVARLREQVG